MLSKMENNLTDKNIFVVIAARVFRVKNAMENYAINSGAIISGNDKQLLI